jgi:lipopolysaccharide/colanic/teichoic acid biosynthesis glycosyltransferase
MTRGDATAAPTDQARTLGPSADGARSPGHGPQPVLPRTVYVRYGKRVVDVAVATVTVLVLLPVLALTALVVLLTMGRPVLYRQDRVGRDGRTFSLVKFRTMRGDRRQADAPFAGPDRRVHHKRDDDPRHTGVGRLLRRTALDELPRLLNVLRGEMSIVGPRPEIVAVAARHGIIDHPRHLVRPGITGLWQVSGDRPGYVHEHLHHDERYVRDISARLDVATMARTIPVLLRRSGR